MGFEESGPAEGRDFRAGGGIKAPAAKSGVGGAVGRKRHCRHIILFEPARRRINRGGSAWAGRKQGLVCCKYLPVTACDRKMKENTPIGYESWTDVENCVYGRWTNGFFTQLSMNLCINIQKYCLKIRSQFVTLIWLIWTKRRG